MSIKIYDAYKMNYNLNESFYILKTLRDSYRKKEKIYLYKKIFKQTISCLDFFNVYNKKYCFDLEKDMNYLRDDIAVLGYFLEVYNINRKKDYPTILDQLHDFQVCLYPIRKKETLLKVYFSDEYQKKFFKDFIESYNIEEYQYQNSTDCPENIKLKNWNKRLKDWKKTGILSSPPSKSLLMLTIHNEEPNYYKGSVFKSNFENFIPTEEERINKLFNHFSEIETCKIFFKDVDPYKKHSYLTNHLNEYYESLENYKKSKEGQLELKRIKSIIKKITWSDLCTKISKLK